MLLKAVLFHSQLIFKVIFGDSYFRKMVLIIMRTCVISRCGAYTALASLNQGVWGTTFSFILGERNPQQVS